MAQEITTDNLQSFIDSGKPVVIDFWAEWCGPCRMVAPIIAELAEKYKDSAIIGKCDVEDNNDLAIKYSVRNIPTIVFLKDGELAEKHVGMATLEKLEEKLKSIM